MTSNADYIHLLKKPKKQKSYSYRVYDEDNVRIGTIYSALERRASFERVHNITPIVRLGEDNEIQKMVIR